MNSNSTINRILTALLVAAALSSGIFTTNALADSVEVLLGEGRAHVTPYPERGCGIAATPDGSIVIADGEGHRVLLISPDGNQIKVVAGTGEKGRRVVPNNPTQTQLISPGGVAVAPDGSIVIADIGNHRVLQVSPDGNRIKVIAGTVKQGPDRTIVPDNPTQTQLSYPGGVAVAPDGSIVIADTGNCRVLRVSSNGNQIKVIAGTEKEGYQQGYPFVPDNPTQTAVDYPRSVAVGPDGSIVVVDGNDGRVLRVSPDGSQIEAIAGTGKEGNTLIQNNPRQTQLSSREGVAVAPNGSIVITDRDNHRVLQISPDGNQIKVIAGTGERGSALVPDNPTQTQLRYPDRVAVAPDGSIVIADAIDELVDEVDEIADETFDDANVIGHRVLRVLDERNVSLVTGTGRLWKALRAGTPKQTQLQNPKGVAVTPDGSIVVVDSYNNRVLRVSPDGNQIKVIAGTGIPGNTLIPDNPTQTELEDPDGVTVAPDGSIVITDTNNHRVLQISPDGNQIKVIAGTEEEGNTLVPDNPTQTQLDEPSGVAVSPDGAIVIADAHNDRVLRVSSNGNRIEVIAGTGISGHTVAPNNPTQTQLSSPEGVAVAPDDSIVITDTNNHRVLQISPDGNQIKVVAGTGTEGNTLVPDDPTQTQLSSPEGVAVAPDDSIVITDTNNHRVLQISPNGNQIKVIAGTGEKGRTLVPDNPTQTQLSYPEGVAIGPDGAIVITDTNRRVLLVDGSDDELGNRLRDLDQRVASSHMVVRKTAVNDLRKLAVPVLKTLTCLNHYWKKQGIERAQLRNVREFNEALSKTIAGLASNITIDGKPLDLPQHVAKRIGAYLSARPFLLLRARLVFDRVMRAKHSLQHNNNELKAHNADQQDIIDHLHNLKAQLRSKYIERETELHQRYCWTAENQSTLGSLILDSIDFPAATSLTSPISGVEQPAVLLLTNANRNTRPIDDDYQPDERQQHTDLQAQKTQLEQYCIELQTQNHQLERHLTTLEQQIQWFTEAEQTELSLQQQNAELMQQIQWLTSVEQAKDQAEKYAYLNRLTLEYTQLQSEVDKEFGLINAQPKPATHQTTPRSKEELVNQITQLRSDNTKHAAQIAELQQQPVETQIDQIETKNAKLRKTLEWFKQADAEFGIDTPANTLSRGSQEPSPASNTPLVNTPPITGPQAEDNKRVTDLDDHPSKRTRLG